MNSSEGRPYVNFAAQIGGREAGCVVDTHLTALFSLLEEYCNHKYAPDLDEIGPVFRVDGDIQNWNKEGCERLRLARKQRYITVDIMMPRSRWEGVSEIEIRRFIAENFKEALRLMVNRLKKEKIEVDDARLFEDYAKVEKEYLAFTDSGESRP